MSMFDTVGKSAGTTARKENTRPRLERAEFDDPRDPRRFFARVPGKPLVAFGHASSRPWRCHSRHPVHPKHRAQTAFMALLHSEPTRSVR
jgi:hypothetical protein